MASRLLLIILAAAIASVNALRPPFRAACSRRAAFVSGFALSAGAFLPAAVAEEASSVFVGRYTGARTGPSTCAHDAHTMTCAVCDTQILFIRAVLVRSHSDPTRLVRINWQTSRVVAAVVNQPTTTCPLSSSSVLVSNRSSSTFQCRPRMGRETLRACGIRAGAAAFAL